MKKLIQVVTDRDRSRLVAREKHFTYPMSGKTYKKTVYVRMGEEPKAPDKPKAAEEPTKGRKKGKPEVEAPTAPPTREEIKARTERPITPEAAAGGEHAKLEPVKRVAVHGGDIRYRILTDKEFATEQALFLYEFQTDIEKKVRSTLFKNVVGFNKPDGKFFSQMMERIFSEGGIKKMIDKMGEARWMGLSREIQNRMAKYSNQLADIYNDNNTYRNFKTLTDAFRQAKSISEKMLKGLTEEHWAGPTAMSEEGAFEAAYSKGFKGKAKTMTSKDIAKRADEKARGPKWKGDSLSKRFENGKYAAEMWHMMKEMQDNRNPVIAEKVRAFITSDPEGYATIKTLMDGKGFGKMVMKEKTALKDFMKKASPYIADALNAYKDLGIALPSAEKFTGKDLKTIKETAVLPKIEDKAPEEKPAESTTSPKTEESPAKTPEKLKPVEETPESSLVKTFSIDEFNIDFGERKGSNPGGLATHKETGKTYYFKEQKSPEHAKNEVLASALYREFGIKTPTMSLVDMGDGRMGTVSRMVENLDRFDVNNEAHVKEARKGYAVDAFLANWDVFGGAWDNMFIEKSSGNARRIDPGGSLLYRARGGEKGSGFGGTVPELDTFMYKDKAGEVFGKNSPFGKMTDAEIKQSYDIFKKVSKERVTSLVDKAGFDKATSDSLKKTLGERYDYITDKLSKVKESDATKGSTPTEKSTKTTKAERSIEIVKSRPEAKVASTGDITKEAVRDTLGERQQKALKYADEQGAMTDERVKDLAKRYKVSEDDVREISSLVSANFEIRINAPFESGATSESYKNLLNDGIFKNQFVRAAEDPSKASSRGSYCPYKGSSRDDWEKNLSDGLLQQNKEYVATDSGAHLPLEVAHERPVYGYVYDPVMGNSATGYGMTSFVLKKEATKRASFTIGDSSGLTRSADKKSEFGTVEGNYALVEHVLSSAKGDVSKVKKNLAEGKQGWGHREYTEAQVYGGVDVTRDVERLVIWDDGSKHDHVIAFAEKYNLPYSVEKMKHYYKW